MDKVGPGNPPKHSQFKKGQSGNPGGLSSETARLIRENAEAAARVRARAFKAIEAKLNETSTDEAIEMLVEAAMLKLLKDSEDRGLGSPVQQVDNTSSDGSMTPKAAELTDEQLARIVAGNDKSG